MGKGLITFDIGAIIYAILITSGPWIISSTYMFLMVAMLNVDEFFSSSLIYSFIFSMIISGGFSFLVTRYISDEFYISNIEAVRRAYGGSIFLVALIALALSISFFLINPYYSFLDAFLAIYALTSLSVLWIQMVFVVSSEKFLPVILSYLSGFTLAMILSLIFKQKFLLFFDAGISLTVGLQNIFIINEIGVPDKLSLEFLKAFKKYPENLLIGFGYYFAVWVDDLIAWAIRGREIIPGFVFSLDYDVPMFLAYLFVIPSLSMFIFFVETEFYTEYRKFYLQIEKGERLWKISNQTERLKQAVRQSIGSIAAVQITMTFIGFAISESLKSLGMSDIAIYIFKWGLIGAGFNVMFLTALLINMYFDFRDIAFQSILVALASNIIFSILTIKTMPGFGFAISFAISFIFISIKFYGRLSNIIRYVFMHSKSGLERSKARRFKPHGFF